MYVRCLASFINNVIDNIYHIWVIKPSHLYMVTKVVKFSFVNSVNLLMPFQRLLRDNFGVKTIFPVPAAGEPLTLGDLKQILMSFFLLKYKTA